MRTDYHTPVLLKDCIEGLRIKPDGVYVDVTYGGGGHSREILKHITNGYVYAFDQDEDSVNVESNVKRLVLIKENFRQVKEALEKKAINKIDGLLADLGVSSHQFDTAARGFSTRFDAKLDMRMSRQLAMSAADVLNEYGEEELKNIFRNYGELKNASRVAQVIINERSKNAIKTVNELKELLKNLAKRGKENQFYAQVFQAIRIEVNDELNSLKEMLNQCTKIIKTGGRLVVISYHSLEDRLVKNFIRSGKFEGEIEKDLFGNTIAPFKAINKKPIEPSAEEIKNNPRSRSAKLRIAEKISD